MRAVPDQHYVMLLMSGLITLAWTLLWIGGQSPYGRYLSHEDLHTIDLANGFVMLAVMTGWLLMIIAMMLPTSLPLVGMFARMTRQRSDRVSLIVLLIVGYLSMWMLFGLVVCVGDGFLHSALERHEWLQTHAWMIGTGILILAGLYQFTPLKYYCLEKCRSPLSFIVAHWQGHHERRRAFQLGWRHGLFCIGCCWSLMLLMFAVGMGNLGWMFILGALMALEKNLPWGQRLSAPVGVILICWGGLEAILAMS
jgi:predicted metal-binding membrane protein